MTNVYIDMYCSISLQTYKICLSNAKTCPFTCKHLHLTQIKVVVSCYPNLVKQILAGNWNQQNISTNARASVVIVVLSTRCSRTRVIVKPLLGSIFTILALITVNKHAL